MKCYNRKTMLPQKPVVDDFWTHDIPLFAGEFRYYRSMHQPVRGKIHIAEEQYFGAASEIVPLKTRKGRCFYILVHAYVFEPKITLTVGLFKQPKHYADQASAIGETTAPAKQEGVREVKIGSAQAWYYPADHTIILWEAFLEEFVQASRIATPFDDPLFERKEYQAFLRSLLEENIQP